MIYWNSIIQELVDKEGKKIDGEDGGLSSDDEKTATNSTTDDFVRTSRQGMSRYLYRGFWGEDSEDGEELELPDGDESRWPDEDEKSKKKGKKVFSDSKSKLKESGTKKMKGVLEDIFTKKQFDDDIVKNYRDNQIKLNGIPPLDTIRDSNPILIRKVSVLKDNIDKNDATGIEKAIILNHLLDMNLADIPREYKEELKKKLA